MFRVDLCIENQNSIKSQDIVKGDCYMKKEIAFIITSMGRGGAERVVSILSDEYVKKGWKVYIVMLWHSIVDYKLNDEISIVDLSHKCSNKMIALPIVVKRLRTFLKKTNCGVVVTFIAENSIVSHFATLGLDIKHIVAERNDPSAGNRSIFLSKAINYCFSKADINVQQTNRSARYYPEIVRKKSVVIPNPISIECKAANNSEKIIVNAGRLVSQKNHRVLIDAFKIFFDSHPDYKLYIFGDGILKEKLNNYIVDLNLSEAVCIKGNVPDLHIQISRADMFVLSSNYEGMSNALLEAMMMGLPCISTDCAGSDEIIENNINGILVPVGDKKELSNAMQSIADNRELNKRFRVNAMNTAEVYKVKNVISMWSNVIEE